MAQTWQTDHFCKRPPHSSQIANSQTGKQTDFPPLALRISQQHLWWVLSPCGACRSSETSGNMFHSHPSEALAAEAQQTQAVHTLHLPVRLYWILGLVGCCLCLKWKSLSFRKQGVKNLSHFPNKAMGLSPGPPLMMAVSQCWFCQRRS